MLTVAKKCIFFLLISMLTFFPLTNPQSRVSFPNPVLILMIILENRSCTALCEMLSVKTWNIVWIFSQLSLATTFNGKSHIELHPPRNLEDIKAFTAVDLLLNLHHGEPIAERRRRWRQHKHRDENSHFVLYLGKRDVSSHSSSTKNSSNK